jgi:hypothetical protein
MADPGRSPGDQSLVAGALLAVVFLAVVLPPAAAAASEPRTPRTQDVVAEAGRCVSRLEEELAVLVADETYAQSLFVGRESSARQRRSLVSVVAWVPTGDPFVWAFFRDVQEVDGDPVRDREHRLEQLFPSGATLAGRVHAQQILEESARYNLGKHRTVNCPTVALSFLHPRNQPRFAFRLQGRDEKEGAATWRVRFSERAHPALTRTSRGEDVPARGLLWIEAASGTLVASRLELRPPGLGPVAIETAYGRDDQLGFWLPREMRETYGKQSLSAGDERVEALARYSSWRRARVDVKIVLPNP